MVGEGDLLRDEREKTPVGKLRLWNWEGLGRGLPDPGKRFGEGSKEETREGKGAGGDFGFREARRRRMRRRGSEIFTVTRDGGRKVKKARYEKVGGKKKEKLKEKCDAWSALFSIKK